MSSTEIVFLSAMLLAAVAVVLALRKQTIQLDLSDLDRLRRRVDELESSNRVLGDLVAQQARRVDELEKMLKVRSDEVYVLRSRLRQAGLDWSGLDRE
jgi:hypothetical protein